MELTIVESSKYSDGTETILYELPDGSYVFYDRTGDVEDYPTLKAYYADQRIMCDKELTVREFDRREEAQGDHNGYRGTS